MAYNRYITDGTLTSRRFLCPIIEFSDWKDAGDCFSIIVDVIQQIYMSLTDGTLTSRRFLCPIIEFIDWKDAGDSFSIIVNVKQQIYMSQQEGP